MVATTYEKILSDLLIEIDINNSYPHNKNVFWGFNSSFQIVSQNIP